jgi:hypothetical protein
MTSVVRSSRHLGSFPRARTDSWTMVGQDGGQTIDLGGRVLMVFSDTLLQPSSPDQPTVYRANCAALLNGSDLRASLRELEFLQGGDGLPREILPATEQERTEGLRFWPAHGVRSAERVYLYYLGIQTLNPDDPWAFRNVGAGLAVLDISTGRCERIRAGDDWCLWPTRADDLHFGVQILSEGGHAYVFGSCRQGLDVSALLARTPLDAIDDRDAYEYFEPAGGRWARDLDGAGDLGPCGGDYSVSFNRYLGRYLMVYVDAFSKNLALRLSDRIEGPYSAPEIVGRLRHAPTTELIYLGFEHPAYALDGGRRVFVSYCEPRFELCSLVEISFR